MNYKESKAKSQARAARREDNRRFQAEVAGKKVKKSKRPKSKSMSKLKKELWAEVAAYVKERDRKVRGDVCRICGKRPIECAYHIIPSHEGAATRYDEENIAGACNACNASEKWNRASYVFLHKKIFGAEMVDRLYEKSRQIVQFKRCDIIEMTERFRGMRG